MTYEMAMLMNWLLVAAGLLSTDLFSGLFDDLFDGSSNDDDTDVVPDPNGETITLSSGDDSTAGTVGDDIIMGLAGNDELAGGEGGDDIEGNTGDDTIMGEAGDDVLAGGGDTDQIFGGAGDDILSSDRLDEDADWTRGGAETLNGGEGDDLLFFSGEDVVTGGDGADTFGAVATDEDPAQITDFEVGVDDVVLYVDGLDGAETAPVLSYATDTDASTTTVSMDGAAVLVFDGVFTAEDLDVTMTDASTINFAGAP